MKLLALDTATESCSAALWLNGEVIERFVHAPQQQANLILPMIDSLMQEFQIKPADLDAVAFGRGPGSFTGLRIAAGVTQGIAFAANLPVVPVSTLQAIAQSAIKQSSHQNILATIDARMSEIYWARYSVSDGFACLQGNEMLTAPEDVSISETEKYIVVGSGLIPYEALLRAKLGSALDASLPDIWPHAADIAVLAVKEFQQGNFVSAEDAVPVYLRDDVAKKKAI